MGITREQALDCFQSNDLVGIGMEADAVRWRLHPERVVGYSIEARIDCSRLGDATTSADLDSFYTSIAEAGDKGAGCIRLLGWTQRMKPGQFEDLLRGTRHRFPAMWLEALSAAEVQHFSSALGFSPRETLARLIDAGLDSIAAEGVPLAGSRFASSAVAHWLEVHRTAHALEMRTVAGMVFGAGETIPQRVDFLHSVHQLQQETGGFAAFAPIAAEAPGGRELDGVTAIERLKTLAIARMFLDNIDTVQASVTSPSLKVLQTSLSFGANDIGAIDPRGSNTEEDIRRIIRDAGFRPAHRQLGYRAALLG